MSATKDGTRHAQVAALAKAIREERGEDEEMKLVFNLLGDVLQDIKDIADATRATREG